MEKNITAISLCKSFDDDIIPNNAVLVDYWGDNINNNDNTYIIYGVYKGLYQKGVTYDLFHTCFLANKLDELIHKKYKHNQSEYYRTFLHKNIIIGDTYYDLNPPDYSNDPHDTSFEILDDNHCPSCHSPGYLSNNRIINAPPDCSVCYKMICKVCSYYDNNNFLNICSQCQISRLK
jgi:hypothetical protein